MSSMTSVLTAAPRAARARDVDATTCAPSRTIQRPPTMTSRTSAAVAQKIAPAGGTPASRTESSAIVVRSASAPALDPPAVVDAEARVAARGRRREQLRRAVAPALAARPGARRARRRAPPRAGRRPRASRCRAPGARPRRRARAPARCRRRGRARSSGRGRRSRPRRAEQRDVRGVGVRRVDRGEALAQRAGVVRGSASAWRRDARARTRSRPAARRRARAAARRAAAAQPATTRAPAGSTARTLWIAAPAPSSADDALGPRLGARVAKPRAAAVQVARVEQHDPDPGLAPRRR